MAELTSMVTSKMSVAPDGIRHEPPRRYPGFRRYGALKEPRSKKNKFKLGKATFTHQQLYSVPVQYRRFPRKSLLKTKYKTPKLRALNKYRRGVVLGLKKKTHRKPAQAPSQRSTRRRTGK